MPAHQALERLDGLRVAADARAGGRVQGPDVVLVRRPLQHAPSPRGRRHSARLHLPQQALGLLVRPRELLHAHEDVDVLQPRVPVLRVEFDAALEHELRLVVRPVARRDLRKQPHALDVRAVRLQETLAQAFRVRQAVLGQVADDGEQVRRQRLEKGKLVIDRGEPLGVAGVVVELGEAPPAIDQGGVGGDRALEGRAGTVEVPQGDVVVPYLLVRPAEARTGPEDGAERVERLGPPVLVALGDGQRVPRFEMVRLAGEHRFHQPRGRVRRPLAEQALRLANPGFRLRHARPAPYPQKGTCLHIPRVAKQLECHAKRGAASPTRGRRRSAGRCCGDAGP